MTGDLGLLPCRQIAIGLTQQFVDLRLQLADFIGNVDLAVAGQVSKLFDFTFELGYGLFKIKVIMHGGFVSIAKTPKREILSSLLFCPSNAGRGYSPLGFLDLWKSKQEW